MIISSKRIEANRRNAQKSTGPKTPEGKAKSRLNSARHNILARQVLVQGHKITESPKEFRALWREYFNHFAPVGPVEEMLVNKIVTTVWRLRRVRTAETAEIALNVDRTWWSRNHEDAHPALLWEQWRAIGNVTHSMKKSALGNYVLRNFLLELMEAIERDGELTTRALNHFTAKLGDKADVLPKKIKQHWNHLLLNSDSLDPVALREHNQEAMLQFLDKELQGIKSGVEKCYARETKIEEECHAAAVLPKPETLDKILRYEAALEKQLSNAMTQLERLQDRRLGQNSQWPKAVELFTDRENTEIAKRTHSEDALNPNEINGNGHRLVLV